MKVLLVFIAACIVSTPVFAAGSAYADRPMGLTSKGVAIIAGYEAQAKKSLPHFDDELSKVNGRSFYVITKIYQKEKFEQIFVQVESKEQEGYKGRIASEPTGLIEFRKGTAITVLQKDVADWCIVRPDGQEEGNLTGKAMEALHARVLVFILSMKPENGIFTRFKVVAVENPITKQPVQELVPEGVVPKIENEAKKRWSSLKAEDEKEKFQYILVKFPEWKIVEK